MSTSAGRPEIPTQLSDLLRSALDGLDVGAVVFDRALRVVFRNTTAGQWLADELTADALLHASFAQSTDIDWHRELQALIDSANPKSFRELIRVDAPTSHARFNLTITTVSAAPDTDPAGGLIIVASASRGHKVHSETAPNNVPGSMFGGGGDIAARIAHELNNPLDGVLRYVSLAIGKLQQAESPEATHCLEQARDGLNRMARIVREVLGYARSNDPNASPVSINRAVEEAIRSLEDRAAEAGVVVTASLRNENMPAVRGNKLFQVCSNIIANALDAMPDGGMLTVSTGVAGDDVVLRFEDTGIGLPTEVERLFDPFFTTKADADGTGLGLAICKDFVDRLGGTIGAARRDEGGSVFTIRLPIDRCIPRDAASRSSRKESTS